MRCSNFPLFSSITDLGRKTFPTGLRAAGISVVTIAEHYGIEKSETVEDQIWMLEAADHGWPVFCCDAKHRRAKLYAPSTNTSTTP